MKSKHVVRTSVPLPPAGSSASDRLKYYGGMPRLAEVEELGGDYVSLLSDAASYTTSIDTRQRRGWYLLDAWKMKGEPG
jgi:hypothetical protein